VAKQNIIDVGCILRLRKMNEEKAESQRGGEHGTNRNIALAVLAGRNIEGLDAHRRQQSCKKEAHNGCDPEEQCTRCSCKAYVGKAMAGEALIAQHHKVADHASGKGNERSRKIGILHKVIVEQYLQICK